MLNDPDEPCPDDEDPVLFPLFQCPFPLFQCQFPLFPCSSRCSGASSSCSRSGASPPLPPPVDSGSVVGGIRSDSGAARGISADAPPPNEAMTVCVPPMIS